MGENGRTRAMLFELIVVVLFLALSSTTLLRLFAAADAQSLRSEAVAYGMLAAQDALERLIAGEAVAELTELEHSGRTYRIAVEAADEVRAAGTLRRYGACVTCAGEEVVELSTAVYLPERSAP